MVMTPSVVSGSAVDCVMVGLGFGNAQGPVGKALMTHLCHLVSSSCMVCKRLSISTLGCRHSVTL